MNQADQEHLEFLAAEPVYLARHAREAAEAADTCIEPGDHWAQPLPYDRTLELGEP